MEVLTCQPGGIRDTSLGQRPSWPLASAGEHFNSVSPLFDGRFGPRPPPSPPYEMSNNYSLPPIADLLAISRRDVVRSPEHRRNLSSHSMGTPPQSHQRNSPAQATSAPRYEQAPPIWSQRRTELDVHPPLVVQPAHKIELAGSALANDSGSRRSNHVSPVFSRPTIDTSSHHWPAQPLSSPYPHSAPVARPAYGDASPHSAVRTASYYGRPHYEHALSAPAGPPPQTFYSDRAHSNQDPATLPPPRAMVDEVTSRRSNFGPYLSHSSASPTMVQVPAGQAQYHPYRQHSRRSSQSSSASGHPVSDYARSSPPLNAASSLGGQSGNYTCDTCDKRFSRPSSLRIHCHSHTGEKPFICPKPSCGKAFSVRSNMKRHERGCHVGGGSHIEHVHDHYMQD